MTSLLPTIVAKSDQLNADDLIGRTLTIKVTKVSLLSDEQPVAIHYEGDNGKPYKPCKSMRRVLVMIWGEDGNQFVGRRMTLFRDEKVTFGPDAVGGIRISHMSDIERDTMVALTAKRGSRKPYTVKPLRPESAADMVDVGEVIAAGRAAALKGKDALNAWWKGLGQAARAAAKPALDAELIETAKRADEPPLDGDDDIDFSNTSAGGNATGAEGGQTASGSESSPGQGPSARTPDDAFPGDAPATTATATAPLTLAGRVRALDKRLLEATSSTKLKTLWANEAALRKDLERSDPEEGVALEERFNDRLAAIETAEREARDA